MSLHFNSFSKEPTTPRPAGRSSTGCRTAYGFLALMMVHLVGCSSGSRVEDHLERAQTHFQAKDFENAKHEYLSVLRLDTNHLEATRRLVDIFLEQRDPTNALPFLQRTKQLEPSNEVLRAKLAGVHLLLGNASAAFDEAAELAKMNPGNPQALLLLARSATAEQIAQLDSFITASNQVQSQDPAFFRGLGLLHLRKGDFGSAERILRQGVELVSDSSGLLHDLGNLHWRSGNLEKAEAAFKQAGEVAPKQSPAKLLLADFKMNTDAQHEAKVILERVITEDPSFTHAWLVLARINFAEKAFAECSANLEKIFALEPNHLGGRLLQARLKSAQGKPDEALADLERIKKEFPKSSDVYHEFALVRLVKKDAAAALEDLKQAVQINPDDVQAVLLLARLMILNGTPNSAIELLVNLLKRDPKIRQAHLLLGDALLSAGKAEGAVKLYEDLLNRNRNDPQVLFLLGTAHQLSGKTAEAAQALERCLELAPASLPALRALVHLDVQAKHYSEALGRLSKLPGTFPNQAEAHYLRAQIYYTQKDFDSCERQLLQATQEQPDHITAHALLLQLYRTTRQTEKANRLVDDLVQRLPDRLDALMLLAIHQQETKRYDEAVATYEKILSKNSQFAPALNNLAYLSCEFLGKCEEAYRHALEARKLNPTDSSTADTLGWILFQRNDYAEALPLLQECANKQPDNLEVQYHLGLAAYMMGEEELAAKALSLAAKADEVSHRQRAEKCLLVLKIDPATATEAELGMLAKGVAEDQKNLMAFVRLAEIHKRRGETEKADAAYRSAAKINPKAAPVVRMASQQ